jgi:glycosidase
MADQTKKTLRNMLMYQVFVRNYSEEGTFEAVRRDLDRIRDLGVDIVYLLPIHPVGEKCRKGTLGSPYAISDYRAVNPEYGTLEDFKALTDAIHEKGMKCIIDVVYNHTSPDSVLAAEHPEWFYRKEDGSFGNHVGDWSDIIDLDYTKEGLAEYQIETLKYWAGMADGFRCDVAPFLPIAFWEKARREVAEVNPDCLWLSESVEPAFIQNMRDIGLNVLSDSEIFRAFDVCYDYDIFEYMTGYLRGENSLAYYAEAVNRQETIYPDNYVKLRCLENHDQARIRSLVPDEKGLRSLTAFSFFQKGMAFVYAGQEYGATHRPSLFDKDTVRMEAEGGCDLTGLIRRLASIKKEPLFTDSTYRVWTSGDEILTACHSRNGAAVVGVFSLKGKMSPAYMPLPNGYYENLIDGKTVEVYNEHVTCFGEPIILKKEN